MEDNKNLDNKEEVLEEVKNEENTANENPEEANAENNEEASNELELTKKLKEENEKLKEELNSTKDTLLRLRAEYDNYRKRTAKEKEGIYADAYVDVVKEILPIIDNLERAMAAEGNVEDLKKGVEMTMKGCSDAFTKLGIEEIDASGTFDPNLHNAVMHIDDDNFDKNVVAEVFQKGYKKGDKVIRHTMVKVAN